MDILQSLVLGVIQGLTEFIPVSSTAHLILAPQVFPIHPPRAEIAHTFDTVIQFGTVIPVLIYFWREWVELARAAVRMLQKYLGAASSPEKVRLDTEERMVRYLLLGSIPAGVVGLLLEKKIEPLADPKNPVAFLIIGSALVGVGIVMWWIERAGRKNRTVEQIRMPDAWIIGIAQAMALIPGVSRSGATMTAGLFLGLTREAAARFSFMLMTPIMFAATGYKLVKVLKGHELVTSAEWQGMLLATVVAAVTGYLAIAFLLGWLRTRSLGFFALWRILVGGFCLCLFFMQR